jgi:hypothetical protein
LARTTDQPSPAATSSPDNRGAASSATPRPVAARPLSAAEREQATKLCHALDDPDLDRRLRAQEQLQKDFVDVATRGGTERQLEVCAEWCATHVGTAPDWYNPQAQPSFDLSGSDSSQP